MNEKRVILSPEELLAHIAEAYKQLAIIFPEWNVIYTLDTETTLGQRRDMLDYTLSISTSVERLKKLLDNESLYPYDY